MAPVRASVPGRSYERITREDLARLARIARCDLADLFARKPRYSPLARRLVCIALCQGAAQHLLDGENGVKDFDVWAFFAAHPDDPPFPWRRRKVSDFGDPKFGRSPDAASFVGRRVDLLGRTIDDPAKTDPAAVLREYLSEGRTKTARRLSEKAAMLLEPTDLLGTVAWPAGVEKAPDLGP